MRIRGAVAGHKKKKKLFKQTKGFWGDRKNHTRLSKDALMKALSYNYIHRKLKKRDFRSLWNVRINVGARLNGISYSKFIQGLKKANCQLNRKMLAEIAYKDPNIFAEIAKMAKTALAG